MIKNLHHVGVVAADIEAAIRFYVETFQCQPVKVVTVDKPGLKLKTAMVSIGASSGTCVQLIEPELGLGVQELREQGEGTILEMALRVEDIEMACNQMKRLGISPVNILGQPLNTNFVTAASGNKYFYLPKEKAQGTSIEIIQIAEGKR